MIIIVRVDCEKSLLFWYCTILLWLLSMLVLHICYYIPIIYEYLMLICIYLIDNSIIIPIIKEKKSQTKQKTGKYHDNL